VLRAQITKAIEAKREITVSDLFRVIKNEVPALSEEMLVREIENLQSQGVVSLEDVAVESSFVVFLSKWELNADFYLLLGLMLAAGFCLYLGPSQYPYVVGEWALGLVFVFLAPGYATMTNFPSRIFPPLETVLISVGLSVVIAMFLGVMLSVFAGGITLNSSMLGLSGYTLFFGFVGRWRKYRSS